MTLRELRAAYPHLFHPNQDWFEGEAFMDRPSHWCVAVPTSVVTTALPGEFAKLQTAVNLANAYVMWPDLPIWSRYLWTADTDHLGQRIYMGVNNGLMEIHRHIHLTERFGVPTWS
jgi:hypothetical protein